MPQDFPIANFNGLFIVNLLVILLVTKLIWRLLLLDFGDKTEAFSRIFHNPVFSTLEGWIFGSRRISKSITHEIGSFD